MKVCVFAYVGVVAAATRPEHRHKLDFLYVIMDCGEKQKKLLTTKAGDTGIENTAMKETGYIEM